MALVWAVDYANPDAWWNTAGALLQLIMFVLLVMVFAPAAAHAVLNLRSRFWTFSALGLFLLLPVPLCEICYVLARFTKNTLFYFPMEGTLFGETCLRVGYACVVCCRFYRLRLVAPVSRRKSLVAYLVMSTLAIAVLIAGLTTSYIARLTDMKDLYAQGYKDRVAGSHRKVSQHVLDMRKLDNMVNIVAFVVLHLASLATDMAFIYIIVSSTRPFRVTRAPAPPPSSAITNLPSTAGAGNDRNTTGFAQPTPLSSASKAMASSKDRSMYNSEGELSLSEKMRIVGAYLPTILLMILYVISLVFNFVDDHASIRQYIVICLAKALVAMECFVFYRFSIHQTKALIRSLGATTTSSSGNAGSRHRSHVNNNARGGLGGSKSNVNHQQQQQQQQRPLNSMASNNNLSQTQVQAQASSSPAMATVTRDAIHSTTTFRPTRVSESGGGDVVISPVSSAFLHQYDDEDDHHELANFEPSSVLKPAPIVTAYQRSQQPRHAVHTPTAYAHSPSFASSSSQSPEPPTYHQMIDQKRVLSTASASTMAKSSIADLRTAAAQQRNSSDVLAAAAVLTSAQDEAARQRFSKDRDFSAALQPPLPTSSSSHFYGRQRQQDLALPDGHNAVTDDNHSDIMHFYSDPSPPRAATAISTATGKLATPKTTATSAYSTISAYSGYTNPNNQTSTTLPSYYYNSPAGESTTSVPDIPDRHQPPIAVAAAPAPAPPLTRMNSASFTYRTSASTVPSTMPLSSTTMTPRQAGPSSSSPPKSQSQLPKHF
ncbi:hypothetical protein RI367_000354 [Sorochytrium milnesiophthora]